MNKFTFLLLFLSFYCLGQNKKLNKSFSIINDNDVYLFISQDQYYTNGIHLDYAFSFEGKKEPKKSKIAHFSIGHQMYTGRKITYQNEDYWDRPFVGYMYARASLIKFIDEKSIITYDVNFGQVGPNANAEELQRILHKVFGMYKVPGWDAQLPNKFGIDFGLKYQREFVKTNSLDISGIAHATIGMNTVNVGVGFPIRLGKITNINKSAFTKGNLTTNAPNNEFFVYYKPAFYYQLKNLTYGKSANVAGGKFKENEIQPFIFNHTLGLTYAKGNSTYGYALIQQMNEIKRLERTIHLYGQISYSYKF